MISISGKGSWNEDDLEALRRFQEPKGKSRHSAPGLEDLKLILSTWSNAEEFGEKLLHALRSYHDVFFKEEEQGIRYDDLPLIEEMTLVPSYWISPFVQIHVTGSRHRLWTFGARPVAGEKIHSFPVTPFLMPFASH